ncbi:MAG TPA: NTP transferase domain-containing protein [Clostridiales bacterium]|nr:MAG: Bifunctional protein GlmU [Firmicutes bacterium ADurb.Bin262]HOU10867.1 NTP transferase domain-containing protein [Clostridiales bacterium]HQK73968.1 NTP transferase domain-containing protein [Clostridiales bacterium]
MKNAVVLCAGAGTKIWPYAQIRSKVMLPVSNKPVVAYTVDALTEMGFDNIVLVAGRFADEIRAYFRDAANVQIIIDSSPKGTAASLLLAREAVMGPFLALYGDTIVQPEDLAALVSAYETQGAPQALVGPVTGRSADCVGCRIEGGLLKEVWGHSRSESTHFFAGFALGREFFEALAYNPSRFAYTEVGMMPPVEAYLEVSVADEMKRGVRFGAVEASRPVFDIDKPWHILAANAAVNEMRCGALTQNELAEGAEIDPTASVGGFVRLGKNSRIGRNVIIKGNIIVGDDTAITDGAIVSGNVVIGNQTSVRNACFIECNSTVGNECIVSHAAELDGLIMDRVYLYHYMEINGVVGENTDFGAATVCGSLRFDDGETIHRIKGRREFPECCADSVFIGDYCRTGVNAILMPGVKVGVYCVIGAGVVLNRDVKDNTLIYAEQNLVEKPWGSEVYGW